MKFGLHQINATGAADGEVPTVVGGRLEYATPPSGGGGGGDLTWTAASFQNAWTNFGSTYATGAYRKDAAGVIHLRGMVKGGTANAAIFTLPVGYRSAADVRVFAVVTSTGIGRVDVLPDGTVKHVSGSTTWVSLDSVAFLP